MFRDLSTPTKLVKGIAKKTLKFPKSRTVILLLSFADSDRAGSWEREEEVEFEGVGFFSLVSYRICVMSWLVLLLLGDSGFLEMWHPNQTLNISISRAHSPSKDSLPTSYFYLFIY